MDPLITTAELNVYLQRTIDPEVAALAVASASGIIRDYCGWSISAETTTFVVDGSGTVLLNLPTLRLISVEEVRVNGAPVTDYVWAARGQLWRAAGWPAEFRCAEADCTHGYEQTPDAVRAVGLSLAGAAALNPAGSLKSKTVGAVTHTYNDAHDVLTELQAFQLSGYRLP